MLPVQTCSTSGKMAWELTVWSFHFSWGCFMWRELFWPAQLSCPGQVWGEAPSQPSQAGDRAMSRWHLQRQELQSMEVSPCPQIASVDKVLQESSWWQSRIFAGRFSMMDEPNLNLPRADSLFSTLRVACLYHHKGGCWCSTSLYHPFHFSQGIGSHHDLAPNQERISAFLMYFLSLSLISISPWRKGS